jgi:hypothetical protein
MGLVLPNRRRYLISLAEELSAQANRVRDLIGDAHWLTDGHHKEYLLIDLLKRHLPVGMVAARGFVISPTGGSAASTEQDILIVDTLAEAPVFSQSGVIIAFPRSVVAAVSIKTTLDSETVKDSTAGLCTVRNMATDHAQPRSLWCGAYYFNEGPTVRRSPHLVFDYIRKAMDATPVKKPVIPDNHPVPMGPDLQCSASELVFKLNHGYQDGSNDPKPAMVAGYRCNGLATAFFLGDLLDHVATQRGLADSDFSLFAEGELVELLEDPQTQDG